MAKAKREEVVIDFIYVDGGKVEILFNNNTKLVILRGSSKETLIRRLAEWLSSTDALFRSLHSHREGWDD